MIMYLINCFFAIINRVREKIRIKRYRKKNIFVHKTARIYAETELGIYCENGIISIGKTSIVTPIDNGWSICSIRTVFELSTFA